MSGTASESNINVAQSEPKKWASEFSTTAPRSQFDIGSSATNTNSTHNRFSTLPSGTGMGKPASPHDNKFSTSPATRSPGGNIQALQNKLGANITGGMPPPGSKYVTMPSRSMGSHIAKSSYVKHGGTAQGSLASFVGQALGVQHKGEHTGMTRVRSRGDSAVMEHGNKMGNRDLARVMGQVVNQAQAVQQGKAEPESASVAFLAKKLQNTTVTSVDDGKVSTQRGGVGSIAAMFGGSVGGAPAAKAPVAEAEVNSTPAPVDSPKAVSVVEEDAATDVVAGAPSPKAASVIEEDTAADADAKQTLSTKAASTEEGDIAADADSDQVDDSGAVDAQAGTENTTENGEAAVVEENDWELVEKIQEDESSVDEAQLA